MVVMPDTDIAFAYSIAERLRLSIETTPVKISRALGRTQHHHLHRHCQGGRRKRHRRCPAASRRPGALPRQAFGPQPGGFRTRRNDAGERAGWRRDVTQTIAMPPCPWPGSHRQSHRATPCRFEEPYPSVLLHLRHSGAGLSNRLATGAVSACFGVNMESVTIVVTAFMLGLGIGSLIGSDGWRCSSLLSAAAADRHHRDLGRPVRRLLAAAFRSCRSPGAGPAVCRGQVAAALGLLFIPTALMGMTLPLLVGYFITRSANVGLSTGDLYRVNTLGAVAGCLAASFLLFPWLGLKAAIWIVAGLNGAIGVSAFVSFARRRWRSRRRRTEIVRPMSRVGAARAMPMRYRTSLAFAFFAGFVSLSYEIFLVRLASSRSGKQYRRPDHHVGGLPARGRPRVPG